MKMRFLPVPAALMGLLILGSTAGAQMRSMRSIPVSPSPPSGPATEQFSDFPLQLRVLDARWSFDRRTGEYVGWGHADILGSDTEGLDFTYTCGAPFQPNLTHGEFYEGQWRKPEVKLDILVQPIGSKHTSRCSLKVALKPARYSKESTTWLDPMQLDPRQLDPRQPGQTAAPYPPAPVVRQSEPTLQRAPQAQQPPPASVPPPPPPAQS